jgi:Domain of unknown function (DUF4349)
MSRRVKVTIAVPLLVIAAVALFALLGLVAGGGSSGSGAGYGAASGVARAPGQATQSVPAPAMGSDSGVAGKDSSGGTAVGTDFAAALPPASAPSSHYLVRTGDMCLLVARGALPATVDRITATTSALGGYLVSSSIGSQATDGGPIAPTPLDTSGTSGGGAPSSPSVVGADPYASLVVRVPEQYFDTAMRRFSRLGDVQTASTSSQDVTSQYVDLQARLSHYRAVERRLVAFLSQTTTVNQMLAVQDRIDRVQLTIEELTAQFKSLRETTTYGTLSVYVSEKHRVSAAVHAGSSFGGTFWRSLLLLGRGAHVAALAVTALVPFIVVFGAVGAGAWLIVRRVRRRRQAAHTSLPA